MGSTLHSGIDARGLSSLLGAAIEYGAEIANSGSLVTRSKYAELFGMSIEDLIAFSSLGKLSIGTLSYDDMLSETESQLSRLPSRIHLSEQISNLFDNTLMSAGTALAGDAFGYSTYLVADILKKATGGIEVPLPMGMSINVADTLRAGVLGASLLGSMGSMLTNLFSPQQLSLSKFSGSTTVTRGGGYKVVDSGVDVGTSQSSYVGASGEDVKSSAIASAKEEAATINADEPDYVKEIRDALYYE